MVLIRTAICIAWVKIGGVRGASDHGFKLLVSWDLFEAPQEAPT